MSIARALRDLALFSRDLSREVAVVACVRIYQRIQRHVQKY